MSTVPPTPAPDPTPTPAAKTPWYQDWVKVTTLLSLILNGILAIVIAMRGGTPQPQPIPVPDNQPVVFSGGMGWVNDPDAVDAAMPQIAAKQGMPAEFGQVAQGIIGAADDDHSVFFWQAEQKVLGKILPSWDQGPVGTCVSFGWGRGCQDLMLLRVANPQDREQWPGHEVATEPIYGGSRVEIGGGRIRGDGSTGAWAGQWVTTRGLLFRQSYNGVDLSTYSPSLSRKWGKSGVPNDLETVAKEHPVQAIARVANATELWAALGNGYPVPVCSDVGYEGTPPSDGIMSPRGNWGHCMLFRGRFVSPTKGKCVVIQNSWGNYLGHQLTVQTVDAGNVELPMGCFAVTLASADRMCRQNDTFAISSLKGFPKQRVHEWIADAAPKRIKRRPLESVFALAP